MFAQSIRLGRILGIPIGVNYSWFVVFVLVAASLTAQFAHQHPDWTRTAHFAFGLVTSLLFFGSVVLHELGHSVVALKYRIPVKSITLFIFGGIAQIGREPERPIHEFNIAIAGPLVSGALGGLFLALAWLTQGALEGVASLALWLGRINLILAVFNLIPGFPLDGGRVLRAVVWSFTGSFERATVIAAGAGAFFAYAFVAAGLWQILLGNVVGGLWIGLIGWFLLTAARMTTMQMRFRSALRGVSAGDVMLEECARLGEDTSVADLVERHLLRSGARCSMVTDGDRFRGLVTLHEIKQLPREEWPSTPLRQIMREKEQVESVTPSTPIDAVLQRMNEHNVSQVPVLDDGRLVGVIGRDRLLALLQTRFELKA